MSNSLHPQFPSDTYKYLNAIHIDTYMYKKSQKMYILNVALQQNVSYTTQNREIVSRIKQKEMICTT